jgi:hypothetical protein
MIRNIGVLQTTVAEIVTVKEHQRTWMPGPDEVENEMLMGVSAGLLDHAVRVVFRVGHPALRRQVKDADGGRSILGPALGGALARPCDNYPTLFSPSGLFGRFPFLLPNMVCAGILATGVVIGLLFLEETHEIKKHERDRGRELGRWMVRQCKKPAHPIRVSKAGEADLEESRSLLEDEAPPGYRTTEGSPPDPSSRAPSPSAPRSDGGGKRARRTVKPCGVQKAFTRPIVLIIMAYGILAL